ncbi:hypothetical protein Desca_0704 [Desulfotomaculum nigrificans CO-1-SRB]|uniref:DUF4321 domain-containing protein n=1 Tax=Desulfotomaculum nigrificans (strain DSM 14880 / VKM B-2319 / CO-1-SRB) TaxID=868595 RepID=F6B8L7_DESCC|nr:DUF4321 domain-containing protein [Desulfotomaculum nigrificans]AEF93589.1 hypothetical protein Desca_0704 [Desulfotomaculum nigrificans CO-1-SRB]
MGKTFKTGKGPGTLLILLLAGGVTGSVLGALAAPYSPWLKNFTNIGLPTTTLNLLFLQLTFGLNMSLGPLTVLGLLIGFFLYRKL